MKPSIPKGTRDFLPEEVFKRNYIFDTIRQAFEIHAYVPIQTPSMENLSTLTGKYGDEGDQLLFKVLNNGDYLAKANQEAYENKDSKKLTPSISKRGLRYDLTVPFARYVVMHQNDLSFPFKRYQIQPVWRADRPQKGRYQEFYQCDADVVGSDSLMYEAELVQIFDQVFNALKLDVTIKINNRKLLQGIVEVAGIKDHFQNFTVAIDKLDKIGMDKVKIEMLNKGIPAESIDKLVTLLGYKTLDEFENAFEHSEVGMKGVEELRTFHKYIDSYPLQNKLEFDITLARGLNYYTGCILEVKSNEVAIGSIAGGGRYDDLTGVFGMKGVSGVGISFGAARIFDCLQEL
ncbi:MAG: histidine--tRNA ligase, partial [Bacteroidota bacterium]